MSGGDHIPRHKIAPTIVISLLFLLGLLSLDHGSLGTVIPLGISLITKELGAHTLGGYKSLTAPLLDTVGVSLVSVVMRACVLLLLLSDVVVVRSLRERRR